MRSKWLLYSLCALAITFCSLGIFFKSEPSPELSYTAQNTYFTPSTKGTNNGHLVRIQVLVNDSPNPGGVQIARAEFNGQDIPLKPRGIDGYRGQGSFQVSPGNYKLKWIVKRDRFSWPRTVNHEELVNVSGQDLWLQLSIIGETASIE